MGDLRLTVASWDEREDLVLELTVEDDTRIEEWGLVTYDEIAGKPVIDLYPRADGGEWHFDLDEVNAILARAKQRIMEVAGPLPNKVAHPRGLAEDGASVVRGEAQVVVAAGVGRESLDH